MKYKVKKDIFSEVVVEFRDGKPYIVQKKLVIPKGTIIELEQVDE